MAVSINVSELIGRRLYRPLVTGQLNPLDRLSSTITRFAGIGQLIDHVTADIAGAASYEDCHRVRANRGTNCGFSRTNPIFLMIAS